MPDADALRARLDDVRTRVAWAARRAGRDPHDVRLVAVSKSFPTASIRAAADAGQTDFGENRVQEALPKIEATRDLALRWHLIGHLQSNKARKAAEQFAVIHSIDSADVLDRVDRAALETGRTVEVLLQVDLAGETTKHGLPASHVRAVAESAIDRRGARMVGLMLLPPWHDDVEVTRPYFAALRRLRDDLVMQGIPASAVAELSMGMSHDFETAIEEGATIVRVGTAIFGHRRQVPG